MICEYAEQNAPDITGEASAVAGAFFLAMLMFRGFTFYSFCAIIDKKYLYCAGYRCNILRIAGEERQ